jgi:hypothetical protein
MTDIQKEIWFFPESENTFLGTNFPSQFSKIKN